ncbi:MAG TPA: S-adenosylmethionine:tRNA ribosyltransferase-isomerase [Nocardioidaceae bacterium]|nr:S-adenosylmethionine:tRNA ribosyltransferase-isomerase [Nocardioidaceae bacterium]
MSIASFEPTAEAGTTPEERGLRRDEVRMLVARTDELSHAQVLDLPHYLSAGDLLVVNTSATLPAAVTLRTGSMLHVSAQLDDGSWVVEVRRPDNRGPAVDVRPGQLLRLPGHQLLRVLGAHPDGQRRLWRACPVPWRDSTDYLGEHGHPIRYPYLHGAVGLEDVQTVYASEPGSAEMPSAGRPLSRSVLVRLIAKGVVVAPVILHTGVSSAESHEPPQPERFTVPDVTARLVNETRRVGRKVVAVGTTSVRALESATAGSRVHAATGWTSLVLGPDRPARVVDGILTGLHDPQASHLMLLDAVAGSALVQQAYDEVTTGPHEYLWHELGDTMLLLP